MIILVRHGEATHHTRNLTGGWTDSVLTEKGKVQVSAAGRALAKYFKECFLTTPLRVLTSDLRRASESARIIACLVGFSGRIESYEFLREKCNGLAANMTEQEAKKIFIPPVSVMDVDHRNYPEGETRREFFDRTVVGLWQVVNMGNANIIVVAHRGSIQNIIFRWMGMDIDDVRRYNFSVDIGPASITILDVNKWKENSILKLNDMSHLSGLRYN